MVKEIIINSSSSQTRVAITEDGKLVDFFIENPEKARMVGDVYFGRVARVLPGIRAAFIDIGLKHDAFLHFSDIGERLEELQSLFDDDDDEEDENNNGKEKNHVNPKEAKQQKQKEIPKLFRGQEIIIQIIKEPVKDKGVRVSSAISIPGRFCVLLPFDNKIGISKKISDFRERRRLRKIARGILPKECGLIIRTAAKDQKENLMEGDVRYLLKVWEKIQDAIKEKEPPSLIYKDLSTTVSVIRDLFTHDVSKVFVDSKKLHREIKSYVELVQPELADKIEYYKEDEPVFEAFRIEEQIKVLMGRKVPLQSGGHIVIEHTEAMVVVDVNSGRYAAKKDQELNSLKTDLEAAREIARQLRLRDIGGLIVIDFIDLEDDKNRKKIYDELKKEFRKDRAKVALLPMTDFGLMQITRERIRENILQSMNEVCPYCMGTGWMIKKANLIHEIEEWLKRYKLAGKRKSLKLKIHPSLVEKLNEGILSTITRFQMRYMLRIKLDVDDKINPREFYFYVSKTGEDLTEEFSI
ncbi:MAG: Rne/Rng family ribonuclease [Melioribacteraceae bacterium]|nr:Rne/Rng family ribonuclease [Melioribacteraceae bacterium]MCF8355843.1 Rne/Rng family ribonuclease [Melioribacteraceae bacterium]MCF8392582.1 Rne/Rng family ribonuclease [Melioribacteraceae bacterium]MCF8418546.1 Rne/Rng family ribonuclease [Melioribacteraceae bacterium]